MDSHQGPERTTGDAQFVLAAVDRALAGDSDAMGSLYRRFSGSVYGLARSIVRDDHEAEDVTQQVFLRLMTSLKTFQPSRGSFQSWLLRVTRNAALDHLRQRPPAPPRETLGLNVPAPETRSAVTETVTDALSALPVRQHRVIVLLHLGLTPAEVALAMDMSEGAVYVLRHRARERLCRVLTEQGVTPATARS
jgi:RNA polymerase sigma-70 factor (ECF subfamily)